MGGGRQDIETKLRQEFDAREQRARELDFLEKGGNPLDFQSGRAKSISAQSTSVADPGEVKGSFALTGDSVESSGRLGRESNSADNLVQFYRDKDRERKSTSHRSKKSNKTPTFDELSLLDVCRKEREFEDSQHFVVKSQSYTRRNRSKSNRDSSRVGDGNGSSKHRHGSRYSKGFVHEVNAKIDLSLCNSTGQNGNLELKTVASGNQLDTDLQHNQDMHASAGNTPDTSDCVRPYLNRKRDGGVSADLDCIARVSTTNLDISENCSNTDGTEERQAESPGLIRKCLELESPISATLGGNNFSDQHRDLGNIVSEKQTFPLEENSVMANFDIDKGSGEPEEVEVLAISNHDDSFPCLNPNGGVSRVKAEGNISDSTPIVLDEVQPLSNPDRTEGKDSSDLKPEKNVGSLPLDKIHMENTGSCSLDRFPGIIDSSRSNLPDVHHVGSTLAAAVELQSRKGSHLKLPSKAHEDSVLEEARSIEAKRRRIAELSAGNYLLKGGRKSQWDFVLEEMSWLANDFMQERVWKITAAAQICHSAVRRGPLRSSTCRKQRNIAHTIAKAILQFWCSAEGLLSSSDTDKSVENCKSDLIEELKIDGNNDVQDANKDQEEAKVDNTATLAVQIYAVRFLKYSSSIGFPIQAEAPSTPERTSDFGTADMSWEDHISEEVIFYTVPPDAMQGYRNSVEFNLSQYEKIGSNMHPEEFETSTYNVSGDFAFRETPYEDYEREIGTCPRTYKGSNPSKFVKNRKKLQKYGDRLGEPGILTENKKRTPNYSGSVPTKRIRTAVSQRGTSPFDSGVIGDVHVPIKTDVSSGDTSSFQDDLSSAHGGSLTKKAMDVESNRDFKAFDYADMSVKPKKKKKFRTDTDCLIEGNGLGYEQRWQLDSTGQNEQRDFLKKRGESHAFESNGINGAIGQYAAKKLKIMNSPESKTHLTGSIPSPVASQLSNMSNSNKFMKLPGANRGRKTKPLKTAAKQYGPGHTWSLYEDQALVVLVHDMGPNWELISDAMNSTMQFKCIFRKPKECKERHKILMDGNVGDGADSAEDSGSSQPHTSALPGIPKGRATKLFYRLHEPMEEDTVKSHFEKIILLGQRQHSFRLQNDDHEIKQMTAIHNSHVMALSQVCPNNLSGVALTPHDLYDATTTSSDAFPLGYQGAQSSALALSDQSSMAAALHTSGTSSLLQGSGIGLYHGIAAPSTSINAPYRYDMSRPASLGEQQKLQQYNQGLSGRNIRHPNFSAAGPDRASNGVINTMNRSGMPMPRPGYQGNNSPASLNLVSSGGMMSPSVAIPSSNGRIGASSGQGISTIRTRDSLHINRNLEDQRQVAMQEYSQVGTPPFNSGFPNLSIQMYPSQQHQINTNSNIQQRYQHRQQQNQFGPSNNLIHRAQSQPLSSSLMQNGSQIHQQQQQGMSSTPMNPISSQPQQRNHLSQIPQGYGRTTQSQVAASSGTLHHQMMMKHRNHPRQQQFQPSQNRNHPQQQRPQIAGKVTMKSVSNRGSMMNMHSTDQSSRIISGLSTSTGNGNTNHVATNADKSEQVITLLTEGESSSSATGGSSQVLQLVPSDPSSNQSIPQQKLLHTEINNINPPSSGYNNTMMTPKHQSVPPLPTPSSPQQRHTGNRALQQICKVNTDASMQSSSTDNGQINHHSFGMATDTSSVYPVVSASAATPLWEQLYDSGVSNPNTSLPGQVPIQRQLSGNNTGARWQQPQQQVQRQSQTQQQSHLQQQQSRTTNSEPG